MSISDRKQPVVKSSAPKKIYQIQFGTLSFVEIQLASEIQVSNKNLFQIPSRNAAPYGCLDPHLGISDKTSSCKTCNKKLSDCAGHFGYIALELPVFHPGYFRHVLTILQCICKKCGRILLPLDERTTNLKRLRGPKMDALLRGSMFKRLVEICKKNSRCFYCNYANGVVKKVGVGCFRIVHEKYRAKNADEVSDEHLRNMQNILISHPELKATITKPVDLMTPIRAYELLCKTTEEDLTLLWMQGQFSRPESLILWTVPVPPVPIRPSVPQELGDGSTEDDLTIKLQEIVSMNNVLRMALEKGATMEMVTEDWENLQIQVALLINGETPGIPRNIVGPKAIRGLCQRLKGKQGRFRGNLSGKRVDFSGRTVISPDPNLRVDQVGVPELVAKLMTFPERVNRYNIEKLQKLVQNGPDVHPGANIVRSGMYVSNLQYGDRRMSASNLKLGDIVERHMMDDDVVLFNRQPSLHKMSIMAHRVKVMPWRTFRFNECCCSPYNADFDGDEMNLHLPQTEESKAEAAELMAITYNLITPRNGEPLVAATQDFLTGSYLLTQKDVFFNRSEFCRLVAYFSDALDHIDMPLPAIWKPLPLWTGKQVISLLVRPNRHSPCLVNIESEERFYTRDKHLCHQDGFVVFKQGELICGNLGKKTLGGESKSGLFYVLIRDFGPQEATKCMSRLAKLCARFLGDRGFSIGVDDVTPSQRMANVKERILQEGQKLANDQIEAYKTGRIRLKPGCNALQSLESEVNGILGKIRENCGKEALIELNPRNAPLCMAQCGSKGSALNISQMIACLGQQSVGGSRIQNGFVNRTLPHFPVDSLTPAAKGFVSNSFFSGLTASEFFFHTMGGREGLVDTAVKTAETGYMARRLMKALEDLSMQYDQTVRNSEQSVVQFCYGDDGLNPQLMEKGDRPVYYPRLIMNVCSKSRLVPNTTQRSIRSNSIGQVPQSPVQSGQPIQPVMVRPKPVAIRRQRSNSVSSIQGGGGGGDRLNVESLTASEMRQIVQEEVTSDRFQRLLPQGRQFIDETIEYFEEFAKSIEKLELLEHSKSDSEAAASTIQDIRTKIKQYSAVERKEWIDQTMVIGSVAYHELHRIMRDNVIHITRPQLLLIFNKAHKKYLRSMIEPGEAVGAVGAQSLSEPGTQMTLKTFHFAGVASMNVTLGVPRLKEIINASPLISTPIIEARLVQNDSMTSARIVKAQIEKTTLGEVVLYIKEVHNPQQSYIAIRLDMDTIQTLHLNINGYSVKQSILHGNYSTSVTRPAVLRSLKENHIAVCGSRFDRLKIYPPDAKDTTMGIPAHQKKYFVLQALKTTLPGVIVQGIPSVSRAIINEEMNDFGKKVYYLLVEGYGLSEVMGCPGVDGKETKCNHVMEMQKVLGIEAARTVIASEIKYIMTAYGITVDRRHLMLLSDVMTFKGEVLGITRFGVAKMKESVLMLASFEKTTDHLFDAAVHSRQDSIVGVSECIIMGVPIPIGTGIFKLLNAPPEPVIIKPRVRLLERLPSIN